jgi:4-hydroxy-tetrahydrodipicolinate reductase
LFHNSDVIIDFSAPEATAEMLNIALKQGATIPIVIGTTGLNERHEELMTSCARNAPVFYSPNMSVVIAILDALVRSVAKALKADEFDVEILEAHHNRKKDAPSGTALMLGHSVASARNQIFQELAQFDRTRGSDPRKAGEIGFAVVRGGSIVGMHDISFNGKFERLSLRHEAYDARIFADGALKIAQWMTDGHLSSGRYTMHDYVLHTLRMGIAFPV